MIEVCMMADGTQVRVSTIWSNGFGRKYLDQVLFDDLASAEAEAEKRKKASPYEAIGYAIQRPVGVHGVDGEEYTQAHGRWWRLGGNSGLHHDCWPVYGTPGVPDLLETNDPAVVERWCREHQRKPDERWGAVAAVSRRPWKSSPAPHCNVVDMQFDHPGWRPDGVETTYTLRNGTVISCGAPYQRGVSITPTPV